MRVFIPQCLYVCVCLTALINEICCENCSALESDSVDIFCRYQGDIVPCESPNLPGTKATLSCKHSYRIPVGNDPGYRELTCLADGVWNRVVFNCIPECGTGVPHGKTFVINGNTAQIGAFPWHVGVYKRIQNESYEQICGGTLVSPNLVISAAHCFFDETLRKVLSATRYAVAAGKFYRPYNISFVDVFAQKSSVKKIDLAERYFGITRNYEQDIALVQLENPFTLTALVRPVCMDWDNTYERQQLQSGKSGKIVGWGKTGAGVPSVTLQEITLPYIHYENCIASVPEDFRGFVTADKFCAGYLNGSSLCEGDSGGGLCFQLDGRWYLRGIVSVGPTDMGTCDRNYYTAFTNIGPFLSWIQAAIVRTGIRPGGQFSERIQTRGCALPEQPRGGSFELGSCKGGPCNIVPGTKVPVGSFIAYKCDEGYILNGYNISFCYDEGWHIPPTCVKTCPALRATNTNIDCRYQGRIVSCESEMAPWTNATLTCKKFYKIPSSYDSRYNEITCLEDGAWNQAAFDCVPECGVEADYRITTIINGSLQIYELFPWSVYISQGNTFVPGTQRPAGTLISLDLVITEASQFDGSISNRTVLEEISSRYLISAYMRGPFRQTSRVKSIEVAQGYAGNRGHYAHNIALIRLSTPFFMTEVVKPICMDWDNMFEKELFRSLEIDQTVGSGNAVSTLPGNENQLAIDVPYFTYEECLTRVQDKYRLYNDMFCIGCGRVSSDCSSAGHGGGGFGCLSYGIWYLLGYQGRSLRVSDSQCEELTTYTKIQNHLDWIRAAYNASTR